MKKTLISLGFIIALSFFAIKPLLMPGFFTHHDDQQVARLFEMDKALAAGQFPVRWVPDLGFGLGYPLFNFYPPLTYYTGEVFHLWGLGFIDSIKLVWLVALLGSGVAMYFLAKKYFGIVGGIVAALFYVYTPYHAIDAYVRGALAELFSFVWLPLVLFFSNQPVIAGIFLALLMITHNLIFLPFVGFYVLWSRNIKNIAISLIIAFGLTAFFWGPSLWEKQYTLVDDLLIKNLASYKIHFACLPQLWDSTWGYGGSIAGCVDGMSFKIGKLHILLAVLAFIIAIIKRSKLSAFCFLLFTLSVFMTTEYSLFIWDHIPQLWYLQFPWRFLEFAALFSAILAGSIFKYIPKYFAPLLIIVLLFFNAKLFVPQTYTNATDAELTSDYEIKQRVSSTSFEYLPKGFPIRAQDYQIESTKFKVLTGDFTEKSQNFMPDEFTLIGKSLQGGVLQINIARFPGWIFWINNKKLVASSFGEYPLAIVRIPPGDISITGRFTDTPVRTMGNLISMVFIAGLAIYGYKRIKK